MKKILAQDLAQFLSRQGARMSCRSPNFRSIRDMVRHSFRDVPRIGRVHQHGQDADAYADLDRTVDAVRVLPAERRSA